MRSSFKFIELRTHSIDVVLLKVEGGFKIRFFVELDLTDLW